VIELLASTKLHFVPTDAEEGSESPHPIVMIQGLRNPCPQIDKFRPGLKESFVVRDEERNIVGRKAGVMGTAEAGGVVERGMRIVVESLGEYQALGCVELQCSQERKVG